MKKLIKNQNTVEAVKNNKLKAAKIEGMQMKGIFGGPRDGGGVGL